MTVGDQIVILRGHYKNRPAVIREVHGDKCVVTLTDTPGPYDVLIRNVKRSDYHNA